MESLREKNKGILRKKERKKESHIVKESQSEFPVVSLISINFFRPCGFVPDQGKLSKYLLIFDSILVRLLE